MKKFALASAPRGRPEFGFEFGEEMTAIATALSTT